MHAISIKPCDDRRKIKKGHGRTPRSVTAASPLFDLSGKRVLIVGGISKIKKFYRRLIEDRKAVFTYHDGWGKRRLEGLISSSDMVLCPVNCNSHNACLNVKKLCKKHCKYVKMLPNSSVSAISHALPGSAHSN